MARWARTSVLIGTLSLVCCGGDKEAKHAQKMTRELHLPEIHKILAADRQKYFRGLAKVAEKIAPAMALESTLRQAQLNKELSRAYKPPRGSPELFSAPFSFLAALDAQGIVIARNGKDNGLIGMALKERAQQLAPIFGGQTELSAFAKLKDAEQDARASALWLFAVPVLWEQKNAGAVAMGIPLWRLAQRIDRQLKVDHSTERDLVTWIYVLEGGHWHHFGTPPELDARLPNPMKMQAKLRAQPQGFTAHLEFFGRHYGYGVYPLAEIGPSVAIAIFRSDPNK